MGVPPIIESLPVLMNASLFLFFTGLILYSRSLIGTNGITWTLVVIAVLSLATYALSSLFPLWMPQCPYKTSLTKLYNATFKVGSALLRQ